VYRSLALDLKLRRCLRQDGPLEETMHTPIFDLDGTLVDTVYAHVFAWQRAFAEAGIDLQ
jgi:hypothetical protein